MYQAVIIDDEKWVVKSLIAALGDQDRFQISAELHDGLSAIRYLKEHEPDLAFLDVQLPGKNGLDILEEANRLKLHTKFIIISGYAEFAYAQKAMLYNAISYCLKPFSREELRRAVEKTWNLLEKEKAEKASSPSADSSCTATRNRTVQSMVSYIHEHYMEELTIQTLADLSSINSNYAGQLFKQHMNQTFNSYLTELRINKSIDLLINTTLPVSQVAAAVGYQDYFYFAKVFKKITHTTPTSYRSEDEPDQIP